MKLKEKSTHLSILKLFGACILSLLISYALPLTLPASAQSSNNDFIAENYNLINEYSAKISQSISAYGELDVSEDKSVSISVTEKMNAHRAALFDLQSHPEVSSRSLCSEIQAAYSRAEATGRLAWIYYYNIPTVLDAAALSRIEAEYLSFSNEINSSTDAAVTDARANVICTEFNRTVYTEKLKGLAGENDSIDTAALIAGAINSLGKTTAPDLFAENFKEIFNKTALDVKLQRTRDGLTYELGEIFKVVSPDESFNSNEAVTLFIYKIKNAQTVNQMNKALCEAISQLTQPKIQGDYSAIYIGKLNESVADASNRASSEGVGTSILSIFENYSLNYQKSLSKDNIWSFLFADNAKSDILVDIERIFNADGGSVDKCHSLPALQAEVECARYVRLVYDEISQAVEKLTVFLGEYDSSAFRSRLEAIQSAAFDTLFEKKNGETNFAAECRSTLEKVKSDTSYILREARAERFLLDNKAILQKSKESITASDELSLRSAITEYLKLEGAVQSTLKSQIENIAEKYNILTCQKIRSLLSDDSLYLDLSELLCTDVKNLSAINIDVFYNNCDRIYLKSEKLRDIISHYRQISAGEIYSKFNESEKKELSDICKKAAEALRKINPEDTLDFEEKLSDAAQSATLSMDRTNECAKVRISAKGSQSSAIQALVAEANAKIKASDNKSEMISISEKAIFKINRELTKEAISKQTDELKLKISQMSFLSDDEKSSYNTQIKSAYSSAYNDAGIAENITVLSFVWNVFEENLKNITAEANSRDLSRATQSYNDIFENNVSELKAKLNSMVHLSEDRRAEFSNSSLLLSNQFKAASALCADSKSVSAEYSKYLEQLCSLEISADTENVNNYKKVIKEKLETFKSLKDNYSVENYNKLEQGIVKAIQKLQSCKTLSDCNELFDATSSAIEKISDLLDDAKADSRAKLDAQIRIYRAVSSSYSQENMLKLENIYNEAIKKLAEYKSIEDTAKISEHTSSTLVLMSSINKDILFTSSDASAILQQSPTYPAGYSFENGYWGYVYQSNGILSGADFQISSINGNYDSIQALIRKAARDNSFISSSKISDQTLKALKKCVVSLGVDISLSSISSNSGKYTVRMLLPDLLAKENVLGVVFVDQNNNVEFYNLQKEDCLVSFDLSHFSSYYIVSESVTDLTSLIIFLTVLLSLEFVILLLAAALHARRKRKERNMPPLLRSLVFHPVLPVSALRVQPQHGVSLCVLLGVCAIALGCGIAFLAKLELKALKLEHQKNMPKDVDSSTDIERSTFFEAQKALEAKEEIPVLCGTKMDFLPSSDDEFEFFSENTLKFDERSTDTRSSFAKKAEVNLDAIAQAFDNGAFVNLEALKKKNLISKRTEYVKILARGTLTKPLVIEAHDFSRAAEEMLEAVGGEAIRIK